MYAHTQRHNAHSAIKHVQKAALAERYFDRLLRLTPVLREDTANGKGFCAQLLPPPALPSCRHCIPAASFQLSHCRHCIPAVLLRLFQCGAGCALVRQQRPCVPARPEHQAKAMAAPTHQALSEAEGCLQVFSGHIFSLSPFQQAFWRTSC